MSLAEKNEMFDFMVQSQTLMVRPSGCAAPVCACLFGACALETDSRRGSTLCCCCGTQITLLVISSLLQFCTVALSTGCPCWENSGGLKRAQQAESMFQLQVRAIAITNLIARGVHPWEALVCLIA